MKCPKGCVIKKRESWSGKYKEEPSELHRQRFMNLSKSGKTLYEYFWCKQCKRVYRKGHRVFSLTG